jgi:hypothetical protein
MERAIQKLREDMKEVKRAVKEGLMFIKVSKRLKIEDVNKEYVSKHYRKPIHDTIVDMKECIRYLKQMDSRIEKEVEE